MKRWQWTSPTLAALVVALLATLLARALGDSRTGFDLWSVWFFNGSKVAAWLCCALGFGLWLNEKICTDARDEFSLSFAFVLGIAAQLVIDQWLGSLGVLHGVLAILVFIPGWILVVRFLWRGEIFDAQVVEDSSWWWWPTLPSVAALLVAASVSPGILWSTEFGGYDALEYHLQAPKEWLTVGSIVPLEFLAYSGMPNFVEGAFMHLMSLGGDARDSAVACQLLHGCILLVAAWVLADTAMVLARRSGLNPRWARVTALSAMLATPWVIVTGSLAYNESGVLLAFAGLLLVFTKRGRMGAWSGLLIGLLLAALVGSKASCVILVVPAVLAWSFFMRPEFIRWQMVAWSGVALTIGLAPWIARNILVAHAPFFPLLSNVLGAGWWSGDQVARWSQAHASASNALERVQAMWNQFFIFGVGDNPIEGEPWKCFWGALPWIGYVAIFILFFKSSARKIATALFAMSVLILLGWMFATHLQSRFLIPLVVPLALACGLAWACMCDHFQWGVSHRSKSSQFIMLLLCAWTNVPVWFLATDTPGAAYFIGQNAYFQGDDDWKALGSASSKEREVVRDAVTAELVINHLQPTWRVLSVGWSAPFWIRQDASLTWSSVWDTNPIEACDGLSSMDAAALLSTNFDAMIIDVPMLERWRQSGWLSPKIKMDQLLEWSKSLPRIAQLRGGRVLLGLRGHTALDWPSAQEKFIDKNSLPSGGHK